MEILILSIKKLVFTPEKLQFSNRNEKEMVPAINNTFQMVNWLLSLKETITKYV